MCLLSAKEAVHRMSNEEYQEYVMVLLKKVKRAKFYKILIEIIKKEIQKY